MPGLKDLLRSFIGISSEDKAKPQEQTLSSSADRTPEGGMASGSIKPLPEDPQLDLHAPLRRLKDGTFSPDDIVILQKALTAKQIVIASRGGVAIGGDVQQSIIITGDGTTFTLTAEALKLLMTKKAIHILYPRNVNFTGRESILTDMRSALDSGGNVALTHVKALTGLGGIGKTQLALEYSYRYQDDYDIVWWLRSEQSSVLLDDYARMAWSLDLEGEDVRDPEFLAGKVKSFLETHSRWLLVFDNAQDVQSLRPYLPNCRGGHMIITSRNPIWGNLARTIEVSKFERSESVKFLLNRTGQGSRKAADELAEALGDLPLALEQAGAYMDANKKPLDEYLKSFQERRLEVLAKSKPSDYPDTVATTWDISFQAVGKDYPVARELLQLFSYLAPDDIPLPYIVKDSGYLPDNVSSVLEDEDRRDEALAALMRYSLISRSGDKISMHRLVQAVTRNCMGKDDKKMWAEMAFKLMDEAFSYDPEDYRTWDACSALLPHAKASADYAEDMGAAINGHLLNQIGLYLKDRAEHLGSMSAIYALGKFPEIDEDTLGTDHPYVLMMVKNMDPDLLFKGDIDGAKEYIVNNMRLVLRVQNGLKDAKKHIERALRIDEQVYGPKHPNVARDVNNLGEVLQDLGDRSEAKKCFERALEIFLEVLGENHALTRKAANNLNSLR